MTGSKGNSVGILIFTVLVASAVIFPLGVALNVLEWPNETTLTDLLLFAPLCALLLGSICLVVIAPTRGIRRLALSAVFLLACAALFTLGIQPRSGKATSGAVSTVGFCGAFPAAWVCALLAARRAAFPAARQAQHLACGQCGYNLTGNVSGVCPECGSTVPQGAISDQRSAISDPASGRSVNVADSLSQERAAQ